MGIGILLVGVYLTVELSTDGSLHLHKIIIFLEKEDEHNYFSITKDKLKTEENDSKRRKED